MIPAKICGITRVEDALLAAELGTAAIGFVFYPKSPRYIDACAAGRISAQLPSHLARVGVFVNPELETITFTAKSAHLTHIQLHGDESIEICKLVPLPLIKTVRNLMEFEKYKNIPLAAFLIDRKTPNQFGGTGQIADWNFCRQVRDCAPAILAGGLSAQNIAAAIELTSPDAVDLSSRVESSPGIKDERKLRDFFATLKKIETSEVRLGHDDFSNFAKSRCPSRTSPFGG